MSNIIHYFVLLSAISIYVTYSGVQFIPERVKVVYINHKYFHNYTYAVIRYGRKSGYYINIESTLKQEWNNNVTLHLIFNEFLHNEYRRSFIELHYKFCDFFKDEKFFAPRILQYGIKCPLPVGTYRLTNLTIPLEEFPSVFPYERARVDIETTITNTSESMSKMYLYCSFKNIRGTYRFTNLSIPLNDFPSVFPYERARIDIEYAVTNTSEVMSKVYLYCSFKNIRV